MNSSIYQENNPQNSNVSIKSGKIENNPNLEFGKFTFGEGLGLEPRTSNLNDEAKAYLNQISELREQVKTLKNEKYELYEEKTSEIRLLKEQLNLGRLNNLQLDNQEDKKKILELELTLKNKQVSEFSQPFLYFQLVLTCSLLDKR